MNKITQEQKNKLLEEKHREAYKDYLDKLPQFYYEHDSYNGKYRLWCDIDPGDRFEMITQRELDEFLKVVKLRVPWIKIHDHLPD